MKRLSKFLAVILALTLVIGSFGTGNTRVRAEETPLLNATQLKEGAKAHGFTLKMINSDDSISGYFQLWEHDKTGASVYLLVNDDPERAFGIIFKTEPSDDTGKLHILEHSCCAASEKYPGRDVFFSISSQSFKTDMNATTWHSSTNYYISSLDEKELMNSADYYLDCAFHSAVRNDPNYFYREAWRYVIDSEEAPLDVTGVVYNEMKGSLSDLDSYTLNYVFRHLYPKSNYAYISGGVPEKILDLTYEELIDFYNKCYHPSNCAAIVYGDIDYDKWLAEFDNYFGKFERDEFTAPEKYVPAGDQGTVYDDFPVYADTEDTSGRLLYIWDLPDDMTYAEYYALSVLAEYENELTSPIMQALNASGIGSQYVLSPYELGDQRQFLVYAYDADTGRADEFKKIVDEQFKAIVKSELDKETIDCMFDESELSNALAYNTSGVGIACVSAITSAIEAQDVEGMIMTSGIDEAARQLFDDGKVLSLFKKAVVKNDNKLLYAVTPKPGLAEENDAKLAKKLQDKKAAMSSEELKAVVAQSKAYDAWNNADEDISATMAKLVTIDPANLDTDAPVYETRLTKKNGVTIATAAVEGEASYFRYSFDISNLSKTKVKQLNEYIKYLGLSTTTRTQEQVSNDSRKYLNSFSARISAQEIDGKEVPSLVISFYAFNDKLEQALDHVFDMLYNTDLDDPYNQSLIAQYEYSFLSSFSDPSTVSSLLSTAAGAHSDYAYALSWRLNGTIRYKYLNRILSSEEEFDKFINGMKKARTKVVKRQNAVVRVVGSADSRDASVASMLARLPKKNKTYKNGSITNLTYLPGNIAFDMNTQASFLLSIYSNADVEPKQAAAQMLILSFMSDQMYIPEFRYGMGAYGAYCGATEEGLVYTQLYRSPAFGVPYARIQETPDEIEGILPYITDEMLEGYKLALISQLITPSGELNMASEALYYLASGKGEDPTYAIAKALQEVTVKDIAEALPGIREAFEKMCVAVVGTTDEIEENKDMFTSIVVLK